MEEDFLFKKETDKIISTFYEVYNSLGYGFLERVYQNALFLELKRRGFHCEAQKQIKVYFKGQEVGEYFADILVNDSIILELKACAHICHEHELQLINYLKATNIELGLLLNFGEKPQVKRKIFDNKRKENLRSSAVSVSSVCHNENDDEE